MEIKTQNWHAWINQSLPMPHTLNVLGDVLVGNPGVEAILMEKNPQGINPEILLLDLFLVQKPGMWPQIETWVQARFRKELFSDSPSYSDVEIFSGENSLVRVKVEKIS